MDQNTQAVLFSFACWFLWVILPMIPSIVIYKMFPKTKVTAQGTISNWKVRAGGAFAAYIVVVLLGYGPFRSTQGKIDVIGNCAWTVHGQVVLRDTNNHQVRGNSLLKALQVTMIPDVVTKLNQVVEIQIPPQGTEIPHYSLAFSIPEFGEQTIDLQHLPSDAEIIPSRRRIDLKDIVVDQFPVPVPPPTLPNAQIRYQQPLSFPGPSPVVAASPAANLPTVPIQSPQSSDGPAPSAGVAATP